MTRQRRGSSRGARTARRSVRARVALGKLEEQPKSQRQSLSLDELQSMALHRILDGATLQSVMNKIQSRIGKWPHLVGEGPKRLGRDPTVSVTRPVPIPDISADDIPEDIAFQVYAARNQVLRQFYRALERGGRLPMTSDEVKDLPFVAFGEGNRIDELDERQTTITHMNDAVLNAVIGMARGRIPQSVVVYCDGGDANYKSGIGNTAAAIFETAQAIRTGQWRSGEPAFPTKMVKHVARILKDPSVKSVKSLLSQLSPKEQTAIKNLIGTKIDGCEFESPFEAFKAPTEEERKQHWTERFIKQIPSRESPKVIRWDRGPAGDGAYNTSLSEERLETMAQEMATRIEQKMKDEDVLFLKFYLHSEKDKQAQVLGKRLARREIVEVMRSLGAMPPGGEQAFDGIMLSIGLFDFSSVNKYDQIEPRFASFIERCSHYSDIPWLKINTDDRFVAKLAVIDYLSAMLKSPSLKHPNLETIKEKIRYELRTNPQRPDYFFKGLIHKRIDRQVKSLVEACDKELKLNEPERRLLKNELDKAKYQKAREFWGGRARLITPLHLVYASATVIAAAALGILVPAMLIPLGIGLILKLAVSFWLTDQDVSNALSGKAESLAQAIKINRAPAGQDPTPAKPSFFGRQRARIGAHIKDQVRKSFEAKGCDEETLLSIDQSIESIRSRAETTALKRKVKSQAIASVIQSSLNIIIASVIAGFSWPALAVGLTSIAIGLAFYALTSYFRLKYSFFGRAELVIMERTKQDLISNTTLNNLNPRKGIVWRFAEARKETIFQKYSKKYNLTNVERAKLHEALDKESVTKAYEFWRGRPLVYCAMPIFEHAAAGGMGAAFGMKPLHWVFIAISAVMSSLGHMISLYRRYNYAMNGAATSMVEAMRDRDTEKHAMPFPIEVTATKSR